MPKRRSPRRPAVLSTRLRRSERRRVELAAVATEETPSSFARRAVLERLDRLFGGADEAGEAEAGSRTDVVCTPAEAVGAPDR